MDADDGGPSSGWSKQVAHAVGRARGRLVSDDTAGAVLALLTSTASHVLTEAAGVGVTLTGPDGGRRTAAASDPVVQHADRLQYALGEGPCLTAWSQGTPVRVDDLLDEPRWPRWAAEAAPLGLRSCLSAPMLVTEGAVGAIKVYALAPRAFGDDDVVTLTMFAAQAAALVSASEVFRRAGSLGEDVQQVLRERAEVARASGVLMHKHGVDDGTAFAHLVRMAHESGVTVREAAAAVLAGVRTPR